MRRPPFLCFQCLILGYFISAVIASDDDGFFIQGTILDHSGLLSTTAVLLAGIQLCALVFEFAPQLGWRLSVPILEVFPSFSP